MLLKKNLRLQICTCCKIGRWSRFIGSLVTAYRVPKVMDNLGN